jgi:signal transduction histidine kinase
VISVSRSLRLKVSLGVCLALVLLLAPLNWLQYELQRRAAMRELELLAATTGAIVKHSLEEAMLANNRSTIQAVIDGVATSPETRSIYLLNPEAVVVASPGELHNGERLDQRGSPCRECHQFPVESRPHGIVVTDTDGQPVFRTMTPILNQPACHRCHSPQDRLNGVLYMDFSMAGLNTRLEQSLRTAFLGSVTIIVLSALVLYLLLSWLFITPMEEVAQGMRHFSQGERSTRVPVQRQDEVGLLANVFNDMADTIQTQDAEAERLYRELAAKDTVRRQLLARLITAREEERQHLAREIHDELGQLLTGLSLFLKLCQQVVPDNLRTAHDYLVKAKDLVRDTIEQSHRLIARLRPTVLDDYGLIPALQDELNQRLAPLGIEAFLDIEADMERLPVDTATSAFRIVQEALTNVIRHANAYQVHIHLGQTNGGLTVVVEDDGVGVSDERLDRANGHQGMGILGMQERAGALGGQLEVTRRQSGGTRVALWLPLSEMPSGVEENGR